MKSRLLPVKELSIGETYAMFKLLNHHFPNVTYNIFEQDLNNKNWILYLYEEDTHIIKGFSTILIYNTDFEGEKISVIYSGDTIVDPSAWSSSTLPRSWIAAVNQLSSIYSQGKVYWLLISGGYRTYRFLPIFWQTFYPHYDVKTPDNISDLMDFLAKERFGDSYDSKNSVVRFPHPQVLSEQLNQIPLERLTDPHIHFFQQRNPGHINGDELVCLTEVCEANLTAAGRRMWFANLYLAPTP
ncbi:MAG: hypothetical protein MET45_28840 [Nostoc sp. LLA-1]|nr:hypothetical protein [Cyanocohniella sp. LLY]